MDDDGDGWASEASGGTDCDDSDASLAQAADNDQDGVSDCDGDCDDLDPDIGPQHSEACDGEDTDCDGETPPDEVDGDGDGSLACDDCDDADDSVERLDLDADGTTTCAGDCDDETAATYPLAPDQYGDGVDTNCDGADGIDVDRDGFAGLSSGGTDCDDADTSVVPTTDSDGDGVLVCADCDDTDPLRSPGLPELCEDGVDNDCGGVVDADADLDGDGFTTCVGDCNDASGAAYPGAYDEWGDGLDLDCDPEGGREGRDLYARRRAPKDGRDRHREGLDPLRVGWRLPPADLPKNPLARGHRGDVLGDSRPRVLES